MNRFLILCSFIFCMCAEVPAQHSQDTLACTKLCCCCCNYDPTPAGVMVSHIHSKKEWMFSYRFMSMGMEKAFTGTRELGQHEVFSNYLMYPDHMRMDMHMLMGMYGITNKLTAMLMLNYISSEMEMSMFSAGGHNHHPGGGDNSQAHEVQSSGTGDTELHLLYGLVEKQQHLVLLSAGISLPTGSTAMKGNSDDIMYPNQRLPYSMQPGSGTFDVLPCINYLYQKEKTTFSAQFSSVLRTGYNTIGYKWGNEAAFNSWFAYRWLRFISSSVRVEAGVSDRIKGSDPTLYYYNEPASHPGNYGGKKINSYIGSQINFRKRYWKNNRIGIEYGIPLYEYFNGIQMRTNHSFSASWSLAF